MISVKHIAFDLEGVLINAFNAPLCDELETKATKTVAWLPQLLIDLRKQGRDITLVSNLTRSTCEKILSNLELLHLFDTIVASDDLDVIKAKPYGDPYLVACSRLRKLPGNFVAIENSTVGLQSAKLAGCWIYVVDDPAKDLASDKLLSWLKIIDSV
jgi:beta-phosphoglucomutase-like phosphatase (HAD superfamily)